MHAPRAVLFDFDHTLSDLGDHVRWADARTELAAIFVEHGVPPAFVEEHPGSVFLYSRVARSDALPRARLDAALHAASTVLARYEEEGAARARVLPGVGESIRALRDAGRQLAVVTSNARAVVIAILARCGLDKAFEAIVGRDEVREPKPSPEGLLAACAQLGVKPAEAVCVGDSVGDIEAARAAGMPALGVRGGISDEGELRAAGAIEVAGSIAELFAVGQAS